MYFRKFCRSSCLFVFLLTGVVATPAFADVGMCGTHSNDDLVADVVSGAHRVHLFDGEVMQRAIPDSRGVMNLTQVGDQIVMSMTLNTGDMEFTLSRVAADEVLDFRGAGYAISLEDIASVTGCDDSENLPQYYGEGYWADVEGRKYEANMRLFVWLGSVGTGGNRTNDPYLWATGVVRSDLFNGKIRFYPG